MDVKQETASCDGKPVSILCGFFFQKKKNKWAQTMSAVTPVYQESLSISATATWYFHTYLWGKQRLRADPEHLLHTLPFTITGYDKTH